MIVSVPVLTAGFTHADAVKLAVVSIAAPAAPLAVVAVFAADAVPGNASTGTLPTELIVSVVERSTPEPTVRSFSPVVSVAAVVFASGITDGRGVPRVLMGQLWKLGVFANAAGEPSEFTSGSGVAVDTFPAASYEATHKTEVSSIGATVSGLLTEHTKVAAPFWLPHTGSAAGRARVTGTEGAGLVVLERDTQYSYPATSVAAPGPIVTGTPTPMVMSVAVVDAVGAAGAVSSIVK